jgi:hypothetical protein
VAAGRPARRALDDRLRASRVRIGLPVAVASVCVAHPTARSIIVGAALAFAGLVVRGAAAGHLSKHTALTTSGPYAVVRHPLYLGSMVVAVGLVLAANSWAAAALVGAYVALFYSLTVRREDEKLARRYGRTFDEYTARVSRVWPRALRDGVRTWRFSWRLYRYNGEFQSAVGVLAALGVLWLRMHGVHASPGVS